MNCNNTLSVLSPIIAFTGLVTALVDEFGDVESGVAESIDDNLVTADSSATA